MGNLPENPLGRTGFIFNFYLSILYVLVLCLHTYLADLHVVPTEARRASVSPYHLELELQNIVSRHVGVLPMEDRCRELASIVP